MLLTVLWFIGSNLRSSTQLLNFIRLTRCQSAPELASFISNTVLWLVDLGVFNYRFDAEDMLEHIYGAILHKI